jgi:hypothetical protein
VVILHGRELIAVRLLVDVRFFIRLGVITSYERVFFSAADVIFFAKEERKIAYELRCQCTCVVRAPDDEKRGGGYR